VLFQGLPLDRALRLPQRQRERLHVWLVTRRVFDLFRTRRRSKEMRLLKAHTPFNAGSWKRKFKIGWSHNVIVVKWQRVVPLPAANHLLCSQRGPAYLASRDERADVEFRRLFPVLKPEHQVVVVPLHVVRVVFRQDDPYGMASDRELEG